MIRSAVAFSQSSSPFLLSKITQRASGSPALSYLSGQAFKFSSRRNQLADSKMTIPPSVSIGPSSIPLTRQEARLRDLLLDVARSIDEAREIKERLELRFAGGWVRDKLLGIPSHDIDVTINKMTGYSFSLRMKKFLEDPINLEKHSLNVSDLGSLHKIAANPEKSKHLETVTTRVLGLEVDFVNLRTETYSADSRNPSMQFGCPKDDALRRDATMNALFYNLQTGEVEDFVGGLCDLRAGLIRTPLEPYQTFVDDPLRILRLIRFASRLDFKLHEDAESCMRNASIRAALRSKISRERVGTEVEKMLRGQNPCGALQLIDRLELYSTIFTDPTIGEPSKPSTGRWSASYNCLEKMRSNESPGSIYKLLVGSGDTTLIAWVLAALSPWAEVQPPFPSHPGGKYPPSLVSNVAREGIKMNNRICDTVTGAFRNFEEVLRLKRAVNIQEKWTKERDTLGMAIRRWDASGGHWKLQAVLAILVDAMRQENIPNYDLLFAEWQRFLDHLQEMDILNAPSWKRLIDGNQLAGALDAKPGRWMAAALDVCMAWQFRNPGARDPAGAIDEVRRKSKELRIPLKAVSADGILPSQ